MRLIRRLVSCVLPNERALWQWSETLHGNKQKPNPDAPQKLLRRVRIWFLLVTVQGFTPLPESTLIG